MKVVDQGLGGANDATLMDVCRRENRTLVTLDIGFADIRAYPPAEGAGCLVFRLARLDKEGVLSAPQRILPALRKETAAGSIWVIDEWWVRIRSGERRRSDDMD
jgi:predicted nuclease of predicted toxin-antitoxin system